MVKPHPQSKRGVYITLAILIILFVGLMVWRVVQLHQQAQTAAATPPAAPVHSTTVSAASGDDNQSLTSDLSTINNGLNNEDQAQDSATSALNDQQQEINVPTN